MRYVAEFREPQAVEALLAGIRQRVTRPWRIMEVCGGQTHAIIRFGLDRLLPPGLELIHGPGCPVCVTPLERIDQAILIAARPEVSFCSFGDMLRVPGSERDLFSVKAGGGDVRVVYSPLDAVRLAQSQPARQVVFFAIGFETTAPANAMAVLEAARLGLENFSVLVSQVTVPPAIAAIMESPGTGVQAFLAAGHVCAVTGYAAYHALARRYRVPIVVTGFEPVDLLRGIQGAVAQLESGRAEVENRYERAVHETGNPAACAVIERVFEVVDIAWRGIGTIPRSGFGLRADYQSFDAARRFGVEGLRVAESPLCLSGEVLQGRRRPDQCPAFGRECTPQHPLGATMVSAEGACAAYYRYGRARAAE